VGNSFGITTDYGLEGPGSNRGGDEIFRPSRPDLGPTQPPVQWVPGLSRGLSAAGACCWENLGEEDHLEDPDVDWRILLK